MNEVDDTLAQLFATPEPLEDGEAFAAAVHRRVARQRSVARAVEIGLVAAIAVAAGTLLVLVPETMLYPVQLLQRLLISPFGAVACVLGAVGLTWWSRFGDA
jgi:class 3 adenylate cyclase